MIFGTGVRAWGLWFGVALVVGCAKPGGDGQSAAPRGGGAPVPVRVAVVAQRPVPEELLTFGNVEASATVEVKSLVGGQVVEEAVVAGSAVQAGAVLYRIDARPYAAALRQAEAAQAKNRVLAADAARVATDAATMFQKGIGSEDEMKNRRATADALAAQLAADAALVEQARLDLEYCEIKAPFDGRAGELLIRRGSLLKAGDGVLTTLAQTRPVHVTFAVPQTRLPEVRAALARQPLRVVASVQGAAAPAGQGTLVFIDNRVDAASGTIKLKAAFPNDDERLWPGQFVQVALTLREDAQALVVPSRAIQDGQRGAYLYVVKEDGTVDARPVQVARPVGDAVVLSGGVEPGERVVIDGQVRLVPGAKVRVIPEAL